MYYMIVLPFIFLARVTGSPISTALISTTTSPSIPHAPEIFVRDNYDGQWVPDVRVPAANPPVSAPPPTPPPPTSSQPGQLPANDIRNTSKMWILYVVIGAIVGLLFIGMIVMLVRALLRWRKTGERPSLLTFGCLPQRDSRYAHREWCNGAQA